MKRFSKKLMALFLCLAMVMSLSMTAFAVEDPEEEEEEEQETPITINLDGVTPTTTPLKDSYGTKQTTRSTAKSEGKKASDVITMDIPDQVDGIFNFFMDPNGLIADSKGARFLATLNAGKDEDDPDYVTKEDLAARFGLTAGEDGKYDWSTLGGIYFAKTTGGTPEPVVGPDSFTTAAKGKPQYVLPGDEAVAEQSHVVKAYLLDGWYIDENTAITSQYVEDHPEYTPFTTGDVSSFDPDDDDPADLNLTLVEGDTIVDDTDTYQAYNLKVIDVAGSPAGDPTIVYVDAENGKLYDEAGAEISDLTTVGITASVAADGLVDALEATGFEPGMVEVGGSISYGPESTELKIINKSNVKVKVSLGVEVTDLPEGITLAEEDDFSDVEEGAALYIAMVSGTGEDIETTAVVTEGEGTAAKNVAEVETHVDAYSGAYELLWDEEFLDNGYNGYYYDIPEDADVDEDDFGVMPFHMTAKMNNDEDHKDDWVDLMGDFAITVTWECLEYEASGEEDGGNKKAFETPEVSRANTTEFGVGNADFAFTAPEGTAMTDFTLTGVYWAADSKGTVKEANAVTYSNRSNGNIRITAANGTAALEAGATHLVFAWTKPDTSEGAEEGAVLTATSVFQVVADPVEEEGT